VVDADRPTSQVLEVPADAAPDVEHETEVQAMQIPAIRRLDRQDPLPPHALQPNQSIGVRVRLRGGRIGGARLVVA
jgi:hypothetical protein